MKRYALLSRGRMRSAVRYSALPVPPVSQITRGIRMTQAGPICPMRCHRPSAEFRWVGQLGAWGDMNMSQPAWEFDGIGPNLQVGSIRLWVDGRECPRIVGQPRGEVACALDPFPQAWPFRSRGYTFDSRWLAIGLNWTLPTKLGHTRGESLFGPLDGAGCNYLPRGPWASTINDTSMGRLLQRRPTGLRCRLTKFYRIVRKEGTPG